MWSRPQTCLGTNNNGVLQWKASNTPGQPVWNSSTRKYDYPTGEIADNYPAFKWAEDLVWKGYDDWRLPTEDELKELWDYGRTYIAYTPDNYWSSSVYSSAYASVVSFSIGLVSGGCKGFGCYLYVRAVRDSQN